MPGVKGAGGPPPKRESQRRRSNGKSPAKTAAKKKAAAKAAEVTKPVTEDLTTPDPDWHPLAQRWFVALGESGQSHWYQPSDWAQARLWAEVLSRELNPQPVLDKEGEVHMLKLPVKGNVLSAFRAQAAALLANEGDRRRVELELQAPPTPEVEDGTVTDLAAWKGRSAL